MTTFGELPQFLYLSIIIVAVDLKINYNQAKNISKIKDPFNFSQNVVTNQLIKNLGWIGGSNCNEWLKQNNTPQLTKQNTSER